MSTTADALRNKYVARLKKIQADSDTEGAHVDADTALCELLTEIGYGEVVAEYDKVDKWYA